MGNQSFAEIMEDFHLMLGGLSKNAERLSKRGISADFIDKFAAAYDELLQLDRDQAALIARQKEKTVQTNQKLAENRGYYREARQSIKLEMPQESWKEFGITSQK
jgi:Seryl-tRNA synthetase